MNKIKSIALSLLAVVSTVSTSVTPALAGDTFTGTHLLLETNLDVWRSPRGRDRHGHIFGRAVQIKPQLLTETVTCPAEEGGNQRVFVGARSHPDMILNVTEPVKLSLFFQANFVSGRRAQLVLRKEGQRNQACFFERLFPLPVRGRSTRVANPSFTQVVQPGRYGVWFGLVDKPARNLDDPDTNEDNFMRILGTGIGVGDINVIHVFVDEPRQ